MPLQRGMYAQPPPWGWHTISHPPTYSAQPLFEPPKPPVLEVPKDPFLPPEEEEEPPQDEAPEDQPEPEAEEPTVDEAPPSGMSLEHASRNT